MKKKTWYSLLSPDLFKAAYQTKNGSLAWPKKQALRIIDLLNSNGYVIQGIDSWLPTNPGPTPLIFDWSASRHANSTKMPNTPDQFIRQFEILHPLQDGQEPVFNFSVRAAS